MRRISFFVSVFVLLASFPRPMLAGRQSETPDNSRYEQEAFINWARQNAIPFDANATGSNFGRLLKVKPKLSDARVIGLGEATHGSAEFFRAKRRMIEFLVKELGFQVFAIEASMPEAYKVNDFVLHGNGDPKQLLKGLSFWTWNTQEVLDLILWMRDFNRSGVGKVEFTGFDMQNPTLAEQTVLDFVKRSDPEYVKTVRQVYDEIGTTRSARNGGQSFGLASARINVAQVAGKHVVLSGYIRTEGVDQGYAGLWLRVDGDVPNHPLVFDNMQDRGAVGTTPWTRFEISVDIPTNATNVVFGVLHPGTGTAWFDALQLRINGVPYATNDIDFDFESQTPVGFFTMGKDYEIKVDPTTAYSAHQSLRITYLSQQASLAKFAKESNARVAQDCDNIVSHLSKSQALFREDGSDENLDWVIQNARLVSQYVHLNNSDQERDESMAENVQWIVNHSPGGKVIVWAHNGHIAYGQYSGYHPMGGYLGQMFGKKYVNFGFSFNEGSFRANELVKGVHAFNIEPAPAGSLDQTLAATGIPMFLLDLRDLPTTGPAAQWAAIPHSTRSIGAIFDESGASTSLVDMRVKLAFDFLIFVEHTSASLPNP